MIGKSDKRLVHSIRCGICHAEIINRAQIYQAGINLGVVCEGCYRQFSAEDLEMMANMFIAYGGYFGMLEDSNFSMLKSLENILKNGLKKNRIVNSEQINIILMHKALLHGISPEHYIQNLAFLVDQ